MLLSSGGLEFMSVACASRVYKSILQCWFQKI